MNLKVPTSLVRAALAWILFVGSMSGLQAQSRTNPCETILVFGTGTSAAGGQLRPGTVDPFFDGISANFPTRGSALVASPIPTAWLAANASPDSQWIAPTLDPSDAAAGTYIYRVTFTTPCAGAVVTGRYAAADRGALRLNGAAVSFPTPATGYSAWTAFSFSGLPAGANTLDFYVTNTPGILGAAGPSGLRAELSVVATCCPCIVLNCPSDVLAKTCSNSVPIQFTISGTNRCDTNLTISCRLAVAGANIPVVSGSQFPPGTNSVVCTATDTAGHSTNCSFRVIVVQDSQGPQIRCPEDIFRLCGTGGTNVYFEVPAVDDVDPSPVVTCTPASGSFFPAGTNSVNCLARDACGRLERCAFRVIIAPEGFTKVLQAGLADDFATSGFEPSTAGLCLANSGYWSGQPFDSAWPGRQMSHSFLGLPNNVTAARLILRLKPTQPGSLDDLLRIGLSNCGAAAQWAFSQSVGSLAALAGGSANWNVSPPTTLTLDLAALPGAINLLPALNTDHRLEFAVGTETMVDYARLELTYCGPSSAFSGVPYAMSNVRPVYRPDAISWRTVNSNDPPILTLDAGGANGLRLEFDDGTIVPCVRVQLPATTSPAVATVLDEPGGALTRVSLSQPGNATGKSIEIWNAGQLVLRRFFPGAADLAAIIPATASARSLEIVPCIFVANFQQPIPIDMAPAGGGEGGATGAIVGDSLRLSYLDEPSPAGAGLIPITLLGGRLDVARFSLRQQSTWFHGRGPQQTTVSDVILSKSLVDLFQSLFGDCINAVPGWSVGLQNPVADWCQWDGISETCFGGHVEINIKAYSGGINFGGLNLTPTLLPTDMCRIDNTVINSSANSITITRTVGSPITLNNVTTADVSHWPVQVTGNAGPQSFAVDLPPDTTVTAAGQTYAATRVTFTANPLILAEFYDACVETIGPPQISMRSFTAPPQAPPPPTCVTLNCPNEITADCAGGSGTPVSFVVTGASRCGSNVVVTCSPPSGSPFPPGVTVVQCTATDSQGNRANCRFPVTVSDHGLPRVIAPARVITPCDGPRGAVVDYTAGARDDCDPSPVVNCVPPSGSLFPIGTNTVTCTALDAAGNRALTRFEVIVGGGCAGNRCIELTMPEDLTTPCNRPGGAVINYSATARDICTGGIATPACNPPSGSVFPVGPTRVICTVGSGASQSAASFLVEVTDTVPPVVQCPHDLVVDAQGLDGAVVTYAVSAEDDCTARPQLRCSPPSGSVFPVGDTRVLCEAADASGNVGRCNFTITVKPPPSLAVHQASPGRLALTWTGPAEVQGTDGLGVGAEWKLIELRPSQTGNQFTLDLPLSGPMRFFRLHALPLVPPPDRDGDGVPDNLDRCPDTPAGLPVNAFGCAISDLIATPDLALGPDQAGLRLIRRDLARWPSAAGLVPTLPDPDRPPTNLPASIFRRNLPQSLLDASNIVRQLDASLASLVRTRALRELELERNGPALDAEHADVRPEDHELMDLERIEQLLTDTYNQHRQIYFNLSNVVRATSSITPRQRLQIQSIDAKRGLAVLTDGRRLLLPRPTTPGAGPLDSIQDALVEGSLVDADLSVLPDGTLYGVTATAAVGVNTSAIAAINPRRLSLRVTPVDFGLPDFDLAPRHYLRAYQWGFTEDLSHHYLEFGQALVAVRLNNPLGSGSYRHWLQISHDSNNDGSFTSLIAKLDENSPPFVFTSATLPQYTAFPIRVREYRAEVVNQIPGPSELIGEDTYVIELNPAGTYAEAFYDQTVFDLADSPSETGHGVAQVTEIGRHFPLTLKPSDQMSFSGASYKATGNSSSYPVVFNIGLNEPFAVHFHDPNEDLFFANPDDADKGIYGPVLKGFNHNREFNYRVRLPFIARDRLYSCPGAPTDTFYRIPLEAVYSVSQGNNGQFTHNGWQRYAWDFPKAGGTTVLAARGGVVTNLRESSTQSCWSSAAQKCQNCSGSASPNFVNVRHRDGTVAWYGHFQNNKVYVSIGQRVYRGTPLGGVGTTGCSTGNHVHFHVVDPDQTTTIPLRFESLTWPIVIFQPCYLPPSNSQGFSTNQQP